MQLEQPDTQDSGTTTGQPGHDVADELIIDTDGENNDADPDLDPPDEEEEEIEVDGRKFALPKTAAEKLKAERLMHADYTRKTQEVAEEHKATAAEREQARQEREQSQQYIKEVAKVHALDDQLAEFNKVDWNALSQSDPALAQQLDFQRRDLERKRAEADQAVTQKQQQNALAEQQATAKQVQEAEAYVQREIPGWNKELGAELNTWALDKGVKLDQAFAKAVIGNPALIVMMHKARMLDQLEKKQSAKPKPAPPPAPVTRVSAARASAAKDPAKMTDAEWARHRKEQQRKR